MSKAVNSSCVADEQREFVIKTYSHLVGAIICFAAASNILLNLGFGEEFYWIIEDNRWTWLLVLCAFVAFGWLADQLVKAEGLQIQYIALGTAILVEAAIFSPIIYATYEYSGYQAIQGAGIGALALCLALTMTARNSRSDFSFLDGFIRLGTVMSLGLIISSIVFDFSLGLLFSYAMLAFAGVCVLRDTARVKSNYHKGRYVAASLELFASAAIMFWYMIQIFGEE